MASRALAPGRQPGHRPVYRRNAVAAGSDAVDQLASVAGDYREGVLLAPYPGMDSQIALTAWTRIDKFDTYDEERITRFINAYLGDDHHVRQ